MLVSAIKNRVKRQFGDQSGAQLIDADIVDWINEAQREIYVKNNLGQKKGTVATVVGTTEYSFPTDLMRLFTVKYDGVTLQGVSQQEIDEFISNIDTVGAIPNGTPTHYYTYAGKIILYPPPDTIKNLTIRYNRFPVDVAIDADAVDVDKIYENRVLDYCNAQACHLDGNVSGYQLFMSRFEGKVNSTLDDEFEMGQQAVYSSITVAPRDADNSYWEAY